MEYDLGGSFALGPWRVRRAGYGAMQLAGDGVFGPPRDRDEALRVLRAAVEAGVDRIDTAQFGSESNSAGHSRRRDSRHAQVTGTPHVQAQIRSTGSRPSSAEPRCRITTPMSRSLRTKPWWRESQLIARLSPSRTNDLLGTTVPAIS